MHTTRRLGAICLLGLAACVTPRIPQPVTPQRPTVLSDTSTTAAGTVELETGLSVYTDGSYWGAPTTVKFGIQDYTEVFVGFAPLEHLDAGSVDATGIGDLFVGMRNRFYDDKHNGVSAAVQLATKLPSGTSSLSTGEVDYFAAGIVSKKLGQGSVTGFYELGLRGDPSGSGTDAQHTLAFAGGHPIHERISGFGEIAGIYTPVDVDLLFTTIGASYALSDSFVLDAGMRFGMNSDTPDLGLLIGLTTNFGRLFRRD